MRLSFRTIDVPADPTPVAYAATTDPPTEAAVVASEPARPGDIYVYELLGILADNLGVLDRTTPGLPIPADPQEDQ